MTAARTTIPVEDICKGDVVRFIPLARSRRVTISVTRPYGYGSVMGYRANLTPDGSVISRGMEDHAYFARPGQHVELLRRQVVA